MTSLTTDVWFLSGVRLITMSAEGIISLYDPTLNLLLIAFWYEILFCSIALSLNVYDMSNPESLIFRP